MEELLLIPIYGPHQQLLHPCLDYLLVFIRLLLQMARVVVPETLLYGVKILELTLERDALVQTLQLMDMSQPMARGM